MPCLLGIQWHNNRLVAGACLPGMKSDELARVLPIPWQSAGDSPALRGCCARDLPPGAEENSWPVQELSDVAFRQEQWLLSLWQLPRDNPQDCGWCDHQDGPIGGEVTTLRHTVIYLVLFNIYTVLHRIAMHLFINCTYFFYSLPPCWCSFVFQPTFEWTF